MPCTIHSQTRLCHPGVPEAPRRGEGCLSLLTEFTQLNLSTEPPAQLGPHHQEGPSGSPQCCLQGEGLPLPRPHTGLSVTFQSTYTSLPKEKALTANATLPRGKRGPCACVLPPFSPGTPRARASPGRRGEQHSPGGTEGHKGRAGEMARLVRHWPGSHWWLSPQYYRWSRRDPWAQSRERAQTKQTFMGILSLLTDISREWGGHRGRTVRAGHQEDRE